MSICIHKLGSNNSDIVLKVADSTDSLETLQEFAKAALSHELFVPGWTLSHDLACLSSKNCLVSRSKLVLAFEENTPVGVLVFIPERIPTQFYSLSMFVDYGYRRKRIGSRLFKELENASSLEERTLFKARAGIIGSGTFWKKHLSNFTY